jgi:hypothetical protein
MDSGIASAAIAAGIAAAIAVASLAMPSDRTAPGTHHPCPPMTATVCERTAMPAVAVIRRAVDTRIDTLGQPTPIRPDSAMTPGATLDVTDVDVCTPGFASRIRHVTAQTKRDVYAEYGITEHGPGDYEVDHLISLELGGSNARKNLWPQSYRTQPWNARVKDALENRLHRMVCAHTISLETAQRAIASDWIAAYGTYMPRSHPRRRPSGG